MVGFNFFFELPDLFLLWPARFFYSFYFGPQCQANKIRMGQIQLVLNNKAEQGRTWIITITNLAFPNLHSFRSCQCEW